MPHYLNTGQRRCYDAGGSVIPCTGTGQDADAAPGVPWPSPRFVVRGDAIEDRLTGLGWARNASLGEWPMGWEQALEWTQRLNIRRHAGHADWRVPNRRELRSLIGHQTRDPALPEGHPFERVFLGWYWTSTTASRHPAYAWYVHMEGGRMFFGRKDEDHLVWPCRGRSPLLPVTGQHGGFDVRGQPVSDGRQDGGLPTGVPWPRPRFVAHAESILDRLTMLQWWPRGDLTGGLTDWKEALAALRSLNQGAGAGHRRWRLPTINELESLVDARTHDPALPADHPFEDPREAYWSSTTSAYETDWGMALYLDKGAVGVGMKKGRYFSVWPVRGPDLSHPAP